MEQHDEGGPDQSGEPGGSGEPSAPRAPAALPWWRRWGRTLLAAMLGGGVVAALTLIPLPYVVEAPGPTFDVIGSSGGTPMIEIGGGRAVDPTRTEGDGAGQLRMVTVTQYGGPGDRLNAVQLIRAKLDSSQTILPYSDVYPSGTTEQQVTQAGQAQMESSQSAAEVAALEQLGYRVPATVTIEDAVAGYDAAKKVKPGDVLVSVTTPDGRAHAVDSASVPFRLTRETPPGTHLTLAVRRSGRTLRFPVTTKAVSGEEGSKLGLYLSARVKSPVAISIHLEKVGGPSAGTMFALGIIDRMTSGDLTGGQDIAGTGAIDYDGWVEPIGGIRQKMVGARRDGAAWFLAPASNCDEVVGHVPSGLRVVRIRTLADALASVKKIAAKRAGSLPTCEAQTGAQSG